MHDWWMAVVVARFGEIVYNGEPLDAYRQYGSNSVGAKNVGSATHILHELRRVSKIQRAIQGKKAQAHVFERMYSSVLPQEDRHFLHDFIKNRSGTVFYWGSGCGFMGCTALWV